MPVVVTLEAGAEAEGGGVVAAAIVGEVVGVGEATVAGEPQAVTSAMSISDRTGVVTLGSVKSERAAAACPLV